MQESSPLSVSRRQMLHLAAGTVGALALPRIGLAVDREVEKAAAKGNIRHSIVSWCFEPYWSFDEMCSFASRLGCKSVELCPPANWPTLKKYGLDVAPSPPATCTCKR